MHTHAIQIYTLHTCDIIGIKLCLLLVFFNINYYQCYILLVQNKMKRLAYLTSFRIVYPELWCTEYYSAQF